MSNDINALNPPYGQGYSSYDGATNNANTGDLSSDTSGTSSPASKDSSEISEEAGQMMQNGEINPNLPKQLDQKFQQVEQKIDSSIQKVKTAKKLKNKEELIQQLEQSKSQVQSQRPQVVNAARQAVKASQEAKQAREKASSISGGSDNGSATTGSRGNTGDVPQTNGSQEEGGNKSLNSDLMSRKNSAISMKSSNQSTNQGAGKDEVPQPPELSSASASTNDTNPKTLKTALAEQQGEVGVIDTTSQRLGLYTEQKTEQKTAEESLVNAFGQQSNAFGQVADSMKQTNETANQASTSMFNASNMMQQAATELMTSKQSLQAAAAALQSNPYTASAGAAMQNTAVQIGIQEAAMMANKMMMQQQGEQMKELANTAKQEEQAALQEKQTADSNKEQEQVKVNEDSTQLAEASDNAGKVEGQRTDNQSKQQETVSALNKLGVKASVVSSDNGDKTNQSAAAQHSSANNTQGAKNNSEKSETNILGDTGTQGAVASAKDTGNAGSVNIDAPKVESTPNISIPNINEKTQAPNIPNTKTDTASVPKIPDNTSKIPETQNKVTSAANKEEINKEKDDKSKEQNKDSSLNTQDSNGVRQSETTGDNTDGGSEKKRLEQRMLALSTEIEGYKAGENGANQTGTNKQNESDPQSSSPLTADTFAGSDNFNTKTLKDDAQKELASVYNEAATRKIPVSPEAATRATKALENSEHKPQGQLVIEGQDTSQSGEFQGKDKGVNGALANAFLNALGSGEKLANNTHQSLNSNNVSSKETQNITPSLDIAA